MRGILILMCVCFPFLNFGSGLEVENVLNNLYKKKDVVLPSVEVMRRALKGYDYLKANKAIKSEKNILTVIDFSLSSTKKRFWVIDLDKYEVLFYSHVAHGKNTGGDMAENFSNVPNSNKSSLGFYLTGDKYVGKHGLSLRLHGLENGINSNAFSRAIVMHGADYVSEAFIQKYGRLGRSFGCPAVSTSICKDVVETISNGTCLFIYFPEEEYFKNSMVFNDIDDILLNESAKKHATR